MFVVVSINPDSVGRRPASGTRGFVTPTVVFFTTAFVLSALLLVPRLPQRSLAMLLMATGVGGIVYLLWTRVHHHWRHGFPDQPPQRLGPGHLDGAAAQAREDAQIKRPPEAAFFVFRLSCYELRVPVITTSTRRLRARP